MVNKQTAVEWLIQELGEYFPHEIGGIHLMVEKAKQMEKEQIIDAYEIGAHHQHWNEVNEDSPERYYNKTYGK